MPKSKEDISLYGGQAERFRELHEDLEDLLGYRPTKTQVAGLLMAGVDDAADMIGRIDRE